MNLANIPQTCTHQSLMRMMRISSETRQAHLKEERQAMLEDTSFKDALQASMEPGQSADTTTAGA